MLTGILDVRHVVLVRAESDARPLIDTSLHPALGRGGARRRRPILGAAQAASWGREVSMGTRLVPVVLAALLPCVGACGGGGGGDPVPPGPEAVLQGVYHAQVLALSWPVSGPGMGDPEYPSCEWGTATADGAGLLELDLTRNVDGEIDPDPAEATVAYTVDPDGSLGFLDRADPSVRFLAGRVAPDGRLATVAKCVADQQPAVVLLERRDGMSYGDATVSGLYVTCGFFASPAATAVYGGVSIGAPGTGTATLATNKEGGVVAASSSPLAYSVASNGATTLSIGALTDLAGGTFLGGDLVVVAGAGIDGKPPTLIAFVRASSDRTEADFSGRYAIVGWQYDVSAGDYIAMAGTLTADGAGTYTTSITMTNGDVVLEDVAGGGAYDVSSVGVLLVSNTLGDVYTGGLSPDGSFAIAAGAIDTGHDPAFFFLYR